MRVAGERRVELTPEALWGVIGDPVELSRALPGGGDPEIEDATRWRGEATLALGLGSLPLELGFTQLESQPPQRLRLAIAARGDGVLIDVETELALAPAGVAASTLRWEADVQVHGPAVVGTAGHALGPLVERQVDQFLDALEVRDVRP